MVHATGCNPVEAGSIPARPSNLSMKGFYVTTLLLNQIIAIDKGSKARIYSDITTLHKQVQKADLYNGFSKTYERLNEDGEELPGEQKKVVITVPNTLVVVQAKMTELFSLTARKDFTNCVAKADVVVGDVTIVKDAPVSYLLFLEKNLTDIRTFLDNLPILDPTETWNLDPNTGLYKTVATKTHRTKKVQRPIVLYDATPEHPAQTQLISEDVLVGFWNMVKVSGAIPATMKSQYVRNTDRLIGAVKQAREKANVTPEVAAPDVGGAVFDYIFAANPVIKTVAA